MFFNRAFLDRPNHSLHNGNSSLHGSADVGGSSWLQSTRPWARSLGFCHKLTVGTKRLSWGFNRMKKFIALAFAASTLLFSGCNKSASLTSGGIPSNFADWGVIELSASNPRHLSLDGTERVFTGTPLADGNVALFIETESTRQTVNMIVPPNVQYSCYVGDKAVRFILKMKAL